MMRAATRRRLAALAMGGCGAVAALAVGCSLGLDRSLIGVIEGPEGGSPDGGDASLDGPSKPPADGPITVTDADGALQSEGGACTTDSDCQTEAATGGACTTASTCDPTWHVCVLTTCASTACHSAVCNPQTKSCSAPTAYGFEATQFSITTGGVGAALHYAIAAAWPFVFVITNNGVAVYDVFDPTNSQPSTVTLHGVPFIPVATLAVGRRVYFVNGTEGGGPAAYRQAVAWVDVPQDSFLTDLQAASAFVEAPDPDVAAVFTNGVDGAFVVYGSAQDFPTADLHPPLSDSTLLSAFPNPGLADGAGIAASTGSRLLTYRYDPTSLFPNFALVNGAGTAAAQTTAEQTVSAFGPVANQGAVTETGGDGSVLWTTGILAFEDGGVTPSIASARLSWLVDTGTSATLDTTAFVDLESYAPPTEAIVAGQPLWIDASRALGLAAASASSTSSTSVQLVTKSPPTVAGTTRTLLPVSPNLVGVATSNGFAYLLAQDDPKNQSCSIYIFAPDCGAVDP